MKKAAVITVILMSSFSAFAECYTVSCGNYMDYHVTYSEHYGAGSSSDSEVKVMEFKRALRIGDTDSILEVMESAEMTSVTVEEVTSALYKNDFKTIKEATEIVKKSIQ